MDIFLKYIESKGEEDLKKELKELYSSFELIRNHYQIKLNKAKLDYKLLSKYKDKITEAIYPDKYMNGGLDIEKVDHIIQELNSNSTLNYYIEVSLHGIEECSNIAHEYGGDFGEDFYIYFEELFEHILQVIQQENLKNKYRIRLEELVSNAIDGYGHQDQLRETLYDYT